jgi:hypothetical protein
LAPVGGRRIGYESGRLRGRTTVRRRIYDSSGTEITITKYTGPGGDVTIPDSITGLPITGIGDFALMDCTSLIRITIPDSVTSIGTHAFYGCNSVTRIDNRTFHGCTSLTSVRIGNGVSGIDESAFQGCTSLTKAYFEGRPPTRSRT